MKRRRQATSQTMMQDQQQERYGRRVLQKFLASLQRRSVMHSHEPGYSLLFPTRHLFIWLYNRPDLGDNSVKMTLSEFLGVTERLSVLPNSNLPQQLRLHSSLRPIFEDDLDKHFVSVTFDQAAEIPECLRDVRWFSNFRQEDYNVSATDSWDEEDLAAEDDAYLSYLTPDEKDEREFHCDYSSPRKQRTSLLTTEAVDEEENKSETKEQEQEQEPWQSRYEQERRLTLRIAVQSDIGRRDGMEDYPIKISRTDAKDRHWQLFGVLDGHGGGSVAHQLANVWLPLLPDIHYVLFPQCDHVTSETLSKAILWIDEQLILHLPLARESGSTLCLGLRIGDDFWNINVGDSRMLLVDSADYRIVWSSQDHRLTFPEEWERVRSAGGEIAEYPYVTRPDRRPRLIAMTRAMGDASLKRGPPILQREGQGQREEDVAPKTCTGGVLSALPTIQHWKWDTMDKKFLVCVSDGILESFVPLRPEDCPQYQRFFFTNKQLQEDALTKFKSEITEFDKQLVEKQHAALTAFLQAQKPDCASRLAGILVGHAILHGSDNASAAVVLDV